MEKSREYSEEQLFLIWFLYHFNQQEIWKGPYYVNKVFETIGRDLVLKKWIDELLEDGLIIGGSESSMLAQISKRGEDFLLSKPYLFKDIAKENSWLLDNIKNDKFLSQISAFKSGKDQEDIKLEMSEELSDQIPEVVKESLRKIGREDIENSREPDYWLVGSYWYTENPRERLPAFDKNNEWINGFGEDKYADLVNSVKPGDILICKSSYYSSRYKSSTLRLKGYGVVAENLNNGTTLKVDWIAINWKYDLPKYGYYRDTISLVYADDIDFIKLKLQEAIDDVFKEPSRAEINRRKHALSKSKTDQSLIEKRYKNQGLIGYIKESYFTGAKELFQRSQFSLNDFIYFFESTVRGGEGDAYETSTMGYVDPLDSEVGIRFRRFYLEEHFNHIYCTSPDLEILDQEGYVEEANQGFESAFLSKVKGEGYSALYVYSTDEDVRLFTPLDERSEQKYDHSSRLHSDGPADQDADAFGRDILTKRVTEQVDELFKSGEYNDSYTILLDGEWGAGKSSMLNFFRKHLKKTDWKIVNYNAWENQSFSDPWWILINAISKKATEESFAGSFNSHRYWKFKLQYRHKVWAFVLLAVFAVSTYFFATSEGFDSNNIGFIGSLLGIIGTIISIVAGLSNNFFFKNISSDELKKEFSDHPYKEIRKRFEEIAMDNNMAIVIDDLDRCNANATVSLLESIQTLFKGQKVLYIIAADGEWISQCFTTKYDDFNEIAEPGVSIGDKFLQKSFQLRVPVPEINDDLLENFYDNLIDHVEQENLENQESVPKEATINPTAKSESTKEQIEQQSEEIQEDIKKNEPKYLKQFSEDFKGSKIAGNPRQMKRFINQYAVERQVKNIESGEDSFEKKDIKRLMFSMVYPSLYVLLQNGKLEDADFLEKMEEKKKPIIKLLTNNQVMIIKDLLEIDS